ncbi:Alkyl sulfatase [Frankia canadensis]|uniref:Alkyl sulfatase n=1 Tax=Frankia canadensis TaxID=1836972 RepID=A0A2I2KT92_9ACTN|nr:SCP2 sterol-binding domain-containing protein [Frankia canadensis]SNQ48893.1 Alkyl sulfatase [Frankia canadensis]SOU56183.1 Alkyl sulfatase [Frankia canadensis]
MADRSQCLAALQAIATRLDVLAAQGRPPRAPDRRIVCRVPDLGTAFHGELRDGCLRDLGEGPRDDAQIVLTVASDDLVALTEGRLSVLTAWRSGRLVVDASVRDLLRVRSLL